MEVKTFEVFSRYLNGCARGVAKIINNKTVVIMMKTPYYGLWWGQHFWHNSREYTFEELKGRAAFLLGRLYEHVMWVREHYDTYKRILEETQDYEKEIKSLYDDAFSHQKAECADLESKANAFYLGALNQEVNHYYEELTEKYGMELLSFSSLKDYIRIIDSINGNGDGRINEEKKGNLH